MKEGREGREGEGGEGRGGEGGREGEGGEERGWREGEGMEGRGGEGGGGADGGHYCKSIVASASNHGTLLYVSARVCPVGDRDAYDPGHRQADPELLGRILRDNPA